MIPLGQLVEIRSGYTFRDAIAELEAGETAVIQAGDINSARLAEAPRVKFDNPKHLLKAGDILVSARGGVVARTVTPDLLPAVAASSVFVLRPHSVHLNSKYIARFLNSPTGQAALRKISSGGYIRTLRKSELATIEIPPPSNNTQNKIVTLGETVDEYKRLLERKQQLIQELYNKTIANIKENK